MIGKQSEAVNSQFNDNSTKKGIGKEKLHVKVKFLKILKTFYI